jgi:hypothetical protein
MRTVDELPDVSFYVLNEPLLAAPEADEVGIWQELAHLRTENHAWRECVEGIVVDVGRHSTSRDALKDAIRERIVRLGGRLAETHHR